mmetsp:Transcript_26153/g.81602  ORF Transcript_26153/g.81602 Transcript_26153/m.81602 type:complete len:204 (+) Transcript_26153:757-1368(+)
MPPERCRVLLVALEEELVAHVIHHHIYDDVHAQLVCGCGQVPELLKSPQAPVYQREILLGILVVHVLAVLENGGDPDGLATHALDIRQPLSDSHEVAAVPKGHVPDIEAALVRLVVPRVAVRKPIGEELVDSKRPPVLGGGKVRVTFPAAAIMSRLMLLLKIDVPLGVVLCTRRSACQPPCGSEGNASNEKLHPCGNEVDYLS